MHMHVGNSDATSTYLTADRDKKHVTSKRVILNRDTDVWTLEVLSAHTPCAYHVRSMFGRYLSVEHDGTVRADTRRPGDKCAIVFVPAAAAPVTQPPPPAAAQPTPGAYAPPCVPGDCPPAPVPQAYPQQPWGTPQPYPVAPAPAPAPAPAQPRGLPPMPSSEYADALGLPPPPPYGAQQQQQAPPQQQQQQIYGIPWDTPAPPYYPQ